VVSVTSLRPYSRISRQEPLLFFYQVAPQYSFHTGSESMCVGSFTSLEEMSSNSNWIGSWVDLKAGLSIGERKKSWCFLELNPTSSTDQLVTCSDRNQLKFI
jgi:hypothetical protein